MSVDPHKLRMQTLRHEELFLQLSEFLPKEMLFERRALGLASVTHFFLRFLSKTNAERLKQERLRKRPCLPVSSILRLFFGLQAGTGS